jgi:hypothetical protein
MKIESCSRLVSLTARPKLKIFTSQSSLSYFGQTLFFGRGYDPLNACGDNQTHYDKALSSLSAFTVSNTMGGLSPEALRLDKMRFSEKSTSGRLVLLLIVRKEIWFTGGRHTLSATSHPLNGPHRSLQLRWRLVQKRSRQSRSAR